MRGVLRVGFAGALVLAEACAGYASDSLMSPQPASEWTDALSEIRVGIHAHRAYWTFLPLTSPFKYNYHEINDVSLDVLLRTPDADFFRWIGSPRPNFGATVNLAGKESLVHAALTWQAHVFDTPVYLEGTFGLAANNGYLTDAPPGFQDMGCRVQFYEVFGLGTDIGEHATATITYEHTSNAYLCEANDGLSNFGIRLGYKF